ncbi:MAG: type IV pilin protein [Bacteriovorax sp.]
MKRWLLKSEQGFTLVELMVVVAIIGILSAIAVPNFKKYQAKSKQSEAKIQLAALYSTEVATNADWDTYATCLVTMGYEQSPRGYYAIGFATGYDATQAVPTFANCNAGSTFSGVTPTGTDIAFQPQVLLGAVSANKPSAISHLVGGNANQTTFTAAAAGSISTAPGVVRDVWNITHTKALSNLPGGI